MNIELEIKYTEEEYMSAVREKIDSMPNNAIYTSLSFITLFTLIAVLTYFKVAFSWWGITLIVLIAIYSVLSLFLSSMGPKLALIFAKKKKLENVYTFVIDQYLIRRSTEIGTIEVAWKQLDSVEIYSENIFFNFKKKNGSMVLPVKRLNEHEITLLKSFAKDT